MANRPRNSFTEAIPLRSHVSHGYPPAERAIKWEIARPPLMRSAKLIKSDDTRSPRDIHARVISVPGPKERETRDYERARL